jgi:hypothetical protein
MQTGSTPASATNKVITSGIVGAAKTFALF